MELEFRRILEITSWENQDGKFDCLLEKYGTRQVLDFIKSKFAEECDGDCEKVHNLNDEVGDLMSEKANYKLKIKELIKKLIGEIDEI